MGLKSASVRACVRPHFKTHFALQIHHVCLTYNVVSLVGVCVGVCVRRIAEYHLISP